MLTHFYASIVSIVVLHVQRFFSKPSIATRMIATTKQHILYATYATTRKRRRGALNHCKLIREEACLSENNAGISYSSYPVHSRPVHSCPKTCPKTNGRIQKPDWTQVTRQNVLTRVQSDADANLSPSSCPLSSISLYFINLKSFDSNRIKRIFGHGIDYIWDFLHPVRIL